MAKKGRSTMSNLDIALDNVDAAFREGEKAGITVEKDTYRSGTYETYESTVKTMIRDLTKNVLGGDVNNKRILPKYMNGKTWDQYFDHLTTKYEQGKITADTIQKRVHALEAFRTMVNNTNVCGKDTQIRVGDKEERLDYLQERGVHKSRDEVTAMKPTTMQKDAVHENINRKTAAGEVSYKVNVFQSETGSRIKAAFKLQVKDVNFDKGTITFRNDKNNFTRTIPMTAGAREVLEPFCKGKSGGTPVFTIKDRDGNDKNFKESVKTVQRYTNEAAKKAGVNRENRRYTTHSNRKIYAQNLYNSTKNLTLKELEKKIGEYVRLQGSNKDMLVQRMKNELNRLNAYRDKMGYERAGFTHEHLRRLYTALHLGHSRCDVVLRYIKPDAKLVETKLKKAS